MVKILGLPFDDYVDKQVDIRQTKLGSYKKAPEELVVFNANTSWVRLSSGINIAANRAYTASVNIGININDVQGVALPRNLVLWGGVSSFNISNGSAVVSAPKGGAEIQAQGNQGFDLAVSQLPPVP